MPTVLYWNINNFTENRVSLAAGRKRTHDDAEYGSGPPGPDHLQLILDTVNNNINPATGATQSVDFIVVVEVYARVGAAVEGNLITGSGLNGCIRLRRGLGRLQWGLVPPVITGAAGQREAVAVYYRKDRWYFLGPDTWPAAYPGNLNAGLPNRTIPGGYPYRANQPEKRSAGRWQFSTWNPGGMPAHLPALVQFPGAPNRKPWLTAFGNILNPALLVRLMGVHTKPNQAGGIPYADQATANLADVWDMTAAPAAAAQQIDVIVGDFNVDNLTTGNFLAGGPFGRLLGLGVNPVAPAYRALVSLPAGLSPNYQSYYHTHGRQRGYARILDQDDAPVGNYPGYRYTDLSLDNALVRYQGLVPPAASHLTIVNRVVDTPFAAPPPPVPPPAPDRGYFQNTCGMNDTIDDIIAMAPDPDEDLNELFRAADNYDRVYRVSDHFALLFEI